MSGFGSGRWYRYGTRPLAEQCLKLDVNKLKRDDLLCAGLHYLVRWEDGSSIGTETLPEELGLSYTINLLVCVPGQEVRQEGCRVVWAWAFLFVQALPQPRRRQSE
jgi:hypothetical protein